MFFRPQSSDHSRVHSLVVPFLLACLAIFALSGCGSGTASSAPSISVTVTVSPSSASIQAGATQQFLATVTGSSNTAVAWTVDGVAGGNATVGTISTAGLYTAPTTAGQHTITATSAADTTKSASATVSATQTISVAVTPVSAAIQAGATQQFQATVTGSSNTAVTWAVDGVTGGNATVGIISTTGLYTAPTTTGQHTITVTSAADTTKSASSTVTVTQTISVAVTPASASVQAGATQQFQATVTGSSTTAVTWAVDGVAGGNTTVGTISTTGLYTAPEAAGQHAITATSAADTTKSASATVTVTQTISVAVTPASASIQAGATQQFQATITGSSNTAVTWSVDGVTSGNETVGTISTAGLYTAPSTAGQHTITATSVADTTKSGNATVTVQATGIPQGGDITIDFNGRSSGVAIPAGLFGSQLGNISDVSEMQTLVTNGIGGTRLYANVQSVFASQTPNWTLIDPILAKLQQVGMKAILMIAYTPTWLQPATSPCTASNSHAYNAAPTDNNAYASIAAKYVAHIDQNFPELVSYYEIWNEADEPNQFCGVNSGDADQQLLNEYKALYQPVAIAMKQQAAADGVTIMVGGPGLGNYYGSNYWISQLVQVTNNGAQLVDFVSYHQYPAGSDVSHTMTWDGTGSTASLYSRTISTTTGIAPIYKSIATAAQSGSYTVPVLLDEFNDDWDFYNDCCKNSPTYSPVWNTMVFSLLMNTVYDGTPMLQHLSYYSASNQPFCLLGYTGDGTYGCGTSGLQLPYPQFRAFELLASPNFLDLHANGGNLANSVSISSAMSSAGLIATGFYTSSSDSLVLVNPTGTAISNAVVTLGKHGFSNPTATQYLLNSSTYSPSSDLTGSALTLTPNGTSSQATITIPAYSVLAVKVTGP